MLRIVPPYCGCGWQSTATARVGSRAALHSASRVRPSLVASVRLHSVTPTIAHTNASTIASSRHAS